MSWLSNLGDVFQLIIDGLEYYSLAEQYSVVHRSETAIHVAFPVFVMRYQNRGRPSFRRVGIAPAAVDPCAA